MHDVCRSCDREPRLLIQSHRRDIGNLGSHLEKIALIVVALHKEVHQSLSDPLTLKRPVNADQIDCLDTFPIRLRGEDSQKASDLSVGGGDKELVATLFPEVAEDPVVFDLIR